MNMQWEDVLDYMSKNGSITPQDALAEYGVMRLSAIIYKLKKKGYNIDTVIESGRNRFDRPVRYARYILEADDAES